jgi:hypothetical protein
LPSAIVADAFVISTTFVHAIEDVELLTVIFTAPVTVEISFVLYVTVRAVACVRDV